MVVNNGFGLEIVPSGRFRAEEINSPYGTYIALANETEYRIKLSNDHKDPCDVEVKLDTQPIGRWRIDPYGMISIEHPHDDPHRFTFFSETSVEAINAGVNIGDVKNGLLVATFFPKKKPCHETAKVSLAVECPSEKTRGVTRGGGSLSDCGSGVTLMGRESHQSYAKSAQLSPDEIDHDQITIITVRLVAKKSNKRPTYYRYHPDTPPRVEDVQ